MKPDLLHGVEDLQSRWQTISDLDRSIAITPILAAGTSGRRLAAALGCGESLIRYLKQLPQASPEERSQLRAGHISTREVLRNIEARQELKADKARETKKAAKLRASERGAKQIMSWLRDEEIFPSYAEQIVIETRRKLAEAEMTNGFPKEEPPVGMPVAEIIRRSGLAVPAVTDDISFVERFACWLALWTCHVMPNIQVRDSALDIAFNKLSVG